MSITDPVLSTNQECGVKDGKRDGWKKRLACSIKLFGTMRFSRAPKFESPFGDGMQSLSRVVGVALCNSIPPTSELPITNPDIKVLSAVWQIREQ